MTLLVIALLSVDEQRGEVDRVEVGNDVIEAGRQAPGETHDHIAKVVNVTRHAPPARGDELAASVRLDELEVLHSRVSGVSAEHVLLIVSTAENVHSHELQHNDGNERPPGKLHTMVSNVTRLKRVCKGHPGEVAECKHEAEAVRGDIHSGEDSRLTPEGIDKIVEVEENDENHRVVELVVGALELLGKHGHVEHAPEDQTGAKLAHILEIKEADARIQAAAHPEIVRKETRATIVTKLEVDGSVGIALGVGGGDD